MTTHTVQRYVFMRFGAALLAAALLAACDSKPADQPPAGDPGQAAPATAPGAANTTPGTVQKPADQSMRGATKAGHFYLRAVPEPNPIPFQKLFELDVQVFRGGDAQTPAEDATLDQVRATMPAHRHGMKNEPQIEELGGGKFRVKGMRFHMQGPGADGHWLLEFVVREGATIDTAQFDLHCCQL